MLKFTTNQVTIEAAEGGERRISGLAVPYDADAVVLGGTKVRVLDGALPTDGTAPRLLAEHDPTRVIGLVTERSSEPGVGMSFTARIASTREGDDILELLTMGALDSVSVGITPTDSDYENGTLVVRAADWEELSVVYSPAFKAAKISEVRRRTKPRTRLERGRNGKPARRGRNRRSFDPRNHPYPNGLRDRKKIHHARSRRLPTSNARGRSPLAPNERQHPCSNRRRTCLRRLNPYTGRRLNL
jgi:HK97 family phage prohead protease